MRRTPMTTRAQTTMIAAALSVVAACGGGQGPAPGPDQVVEPGQSVGLALPADRQAELDGISAELVATASMSGEEFAQKYRVPFATALGYDPAQAANLPAIQASALSLATGELAALAANGFVISAARRYPTFTYGYESIYSQDLPVFISADSILHAVHKSYDDILKAVELASLIPELDAMLGEMRARLAAGGGAGLGADAHSDADLFLAVAASLLGTTAKAPVAGASGSQVTALVSKANAASGTQELTLFGVKRIVDFSQFTVRGHYKDDPALERYFRAMMWLGRIEFPIIEFDIGADGKVTQTFHRRVLEDALLLADLMPEATLARWQRIDAALRAFVGEPDSMSPADVGRLRADVGISDLAALAAISDQRLAQAIVDGGYGQQRIASQVIISPPHQGALPLAATFLLLGQRYVVDSHVFSNLVYDRFNKGTPLRMMPNPLDVAFAALHNDHAGALLGADIAEHKYASALHGMRYLVDAEGQDFWGANLYNIWLSALRTLSPVGEEVAAARTAGLPAVAATEPWGRRILNAQLASWAELRHDTILYAKQSYSGGVSCEFPDGYVEPNPAFFARVGALAAAGTALVGVLDLSGSPDLATGVTSYFTHLGDVAAILGRMAERQRTGAPHDAADIDFINRAVRFIPGCGPPAGATGWYPELYFGGADLTFDPTIADVHTQPTDEAGNDVGRVLHVGTGMPRLIVVTVDTCTGPRAYAGLASSYYETVTENFDRLDDQRWSQTLTTATPADVPWMSDLFAR